MTDPLRWVTSPGRECPGSCLSGSGVSVHLDAERGDYHMTVGPEAETDEVSHVLKALGRVGIRLLDLEECDPVILTGGAVMLYLTTAQWDIH